MNADVEKAVVLDDFYEVECPDHSRTSCSDEHPVNADVTGNGCPRCNAIFFTKAEAAFEALRDQEAEIANLKPRLDAVLADRRQWYAKAAALRNRAEKAEALLCDVSRYLDPRQFPEVIARITAHLGANHD